MEKYDNDMDFLSKSFDYVIKQILHCGKKIVDFGIDWYCIQILCPKAV